VAFAVDKMAAMNDRSLSKGCRAKRNQDKKYTGSQCGLILGLSKLDYQRRGVTASGISG
jgi:hypothetical protein